LIDWFGFTVPEAMRPVMMRPRKGFASSNVPSIRNGPSSTRAWGTCSRTRLKSGARPSDWSPSGAVAIQPARPEP